ncbi:MAG: hypothetical protein M0015_18215, partial [Betaproteobacteria bacterium]|nr:hypothetical protein [Betaproteobacteria bacterium]
MIANVLTKIFGSRNERLLKQYSRTVIRINALEPQIAALTDAQLRARTDEFKQRVAERVSAEPEEARADAERLVLDELLPEAFA